MLFYNNWERLPYGYENKLQRQHIDVNIICDKQPLKYETTASQTTHITVYSMPGLTLHHTPGPLLTSTPPWECRWPVDSRGEGARSVPCLPGGLPHCSTGYEMACGPLTIFQTEPYHSSRHRWLLYTSCRAVPKERKFTELLMQFSTTTCFPIHTCSPTLLFSYSPFS